MPSRRARTLGWWKYVGLDGDVIGLDRFGASAPGPKVMAEFGFTRGECGGAGEGAVKKQGLGELGIRDREFDDNC